MRSITWLDGGRLAALGAAPGLGTAGAMWYCGKGAASRVPGSQSQSSRVSSQGLWCALGRRDRRRQAGWPLGERILCLSLHQGLSE